MAFHSRISISLVCCGRLPLVQGLELVRSMDVGVVSLTMAQLADRAETAVGAVKASGLRVASLGTGGACLVASGAETLRALRPVIEAAAALASPVAFSVSGATPAGMAGDQAFDALVSTIGPARELAASLGVRLGIENSAQASRQLGFITTLADACALAEAADLGLVVELQNCWTEARLADLFRRHLARIAIVNVSDFRLGEDLRFNRRVPGDGDMPLEWLLGTLLDAGYAGFFDLEMLGPAIEAEGPADAIRRGVEWISNRLESWGV